MKTKRSPLALMEVASLLGGVRPARYNVQRDDSCGAQRSGAPKKDYAFNWAYVRRTMASKAKHMPK